MMTVSNEGRVLGEEGEESRGMVSRNASGTGERVFFSIFISLLVYFFF